MTLKKKTLKPFDKWVSEAPTHPFVEALLEFLQFVVILLVIAVGAAAMFFTGIADASPAFTPAYVAAAKRAGEPVDRDYGQSRWYDGPCAGRTYFECTPSKGSSGGTAKGLSK